LGALYDHFANMIELFSKHCHFMTPAMPSAEEFSKTGASVAIIVHPALGPLWSIIAKKIVKGALHRNAELILDIEALQIDTLVVKGSLMILAKEPLGLADEQGHTIFSEKRGRARLRNVTVNNQVETRALDQFMQRPLERRGLVIVLEGFSEIDIQDTLFEEEEEIVVPHGFKLTIINGERRTEELREPSWQWHYAVAGSTIELEYEENRLSQQTTLP
jgi:hypothetical protein